MVSNATYGSVSLQRPEGGADMEADETPILTFHGTTPTRQHILEKVGSYTGGLDEIQRRNAMLGFLAIIILALNFVLGWMAARVTYSEQITPSLGSFLPEDVPLDFTLMHFTDVHVEPLYDRSQVVKGSCRDDSCCGSKGGKCELFAYSQEEAPTLGCDPPVQLLENALKAMKAVDENTDYLIFTGDMVAHHLCNEDIVRQTQVEFFKRVEGVFPSTPLVYALGNNDLWPNNRNSVKSFKAVYDIMKAECPSCAPFLYNAEENQKTFLSGGYYVYRDANKHVTVLILNSGLWSPRYDNKDLPSSLPDEHMKWLTDQLALARTQRDQVILASHIPPGHVRHSMDWEVRYLDQYVKLCTQYADIIKGQFFGHHSKEYIRSFSKDVGVLVSSGLTPLGGGSLIFSGVKDPANPTFRYGLFAHKKFYDMWTFYLDLSSGQRRGQSANPQTFYGEGLGAQKAGALVVDDIPVTIQKTRFAKAQMQAASQGWRLMYSFRETYKTEDVSSLSIFIASQRILHDSKYTARYESFLGGLHSNQRLIACDVHTLSPKDDATHECYDRLCLYDVSQTCSD